jgi:iron(III) transport system ATP-binding protein
MALDDFIYLIYLGDHWEYRIHRGGFVAKAHGTRRLESGKVWAKIQQEAVWVFPAQK